VKRLRPAVAVKWQQVLFEARCSVHVPTHFIR
jgi:hypothetical protein